MNPKLYLVKINKNCDYELKKAEDLKFAVGYYEVLEITNTKPIKLSLLIEDLNES